MTQATAPLTAPGHPAFELLGTRPINALHLEVERRNRAARRLYQRLGYHDQDRHLMTLRFDRPARGEPTGD